MSVCDECRKNKYCSNDCRKRIQEIELEINEKVINAIFSLSAKGIKRSKEVGEHDQKEQNR